MKGAGKYLRLVGGMGLVVWATWKGSILALGILATLGIISEFVWAWAWEVEQRRQRVLRGESLE